MCGLVVPLFCPFYSQDEMASCNKKAINHTVIMGDASGTKE